MNKKSVFIKTVMFFGVPMLSFGSANAAQFMDGKLSINGAVMQAFQSPIELEGPGRVTTADDEASAGFQRFRYALHINAEIDEMWSVFAELSEEPNDLSTDAGFDPFGIHMDLGWIQADFNNGVKARLGTILSTTQTFLRYSDGPVVQSNPFIGNTPVDMITAEEGLWLLGAEEIGSGTDITWDLGVSSPSFLRDHTESAGFNLQARGTVNFDNGLSLGTGLFKTNGDVDCSGGVCSRVDGAVVNSLIGLGDGDNYAFATRGPSQVNHVAIIPGIEAFIWQLNAQYRKGPMLIHGFYGQAKDNYAWLDAGGEYRPISASFEKVDAEMAFYGLETKVDVADDLYVAARYTASENETGDISTDNSLYRWQLAGGYHFTDSALLKVEYAKQKEEALSGGQNVDGTGSAEWDGVSVEMSLVF